MIKLSVLATIILSKKDLMIVKNETNFLVENGRYKSIFIKGNSEEIYKNEKLFLLNLLRNKI